MVVRHQGQQVGRLAEGSTTPAGPGRAPHRHKSPSRAGRPRPGSSGHHLGRQVADGRSGAGGATEAIGPDSTSGEGWGALCAKLHAAQGIGLVEADIVPLARPGVGLIGKRRGRGDEGQPVGGRGQRPRARDQDRGVVQASELAGLGGQAGPRPPRRRSAASASVSASPIGGRMASAIRRDRSPEGRSSPTCRVWRRPGP